MSKAFEKFKVKTRSNPVPAPAPAPEPDVISTPVFSAVATYLDQRELPFLDKPEAKVLNWDSIPEDPTAISSPELGRLHIGLTRWLAYAGSELARATIKIIDFEQQIKRRKAKLIFENTGGRKKYEVDAEILLDDEYMKIDDARVMEEARKVALQSTFDRYERICATLSRELTRRGQELESVSRGEHTPRR